MLIWFYINNQCLNYLISICRHSLQATFIKTCHIYNQIKNQGSSTSKFEKNKKNPIINSNMHYYFFKFFFNSLGNLILLLKSIIQIEPWNKGSYNYKWRTHHIKRMILQYKYKIFMLIKVYTIENVGLDLGPCVGEFIEGIVRLISKSTILYGSHNIHKHIILKKPR